MAHFEYIGIDPFRTDLNRVLLASVKNRILSGRDVNDQPVPALSRGYARAKQRRGLAPRRDWTFTGQLMNSIGIVQNSAGLSIGFTNPVAVRKAAINNARVREWGVSPHDRENVVDAINAIRNQLVRVA